MKARLISPQRSVNPAFSSKEKRAVESHGKSYNVPMYLELPEGFEVEGSQVWGLCCPGHMNAAPVAEPVDDECKERVKKWMTTERPRQLEQIRQMAQPENLKRLKKEAKQHVLDLVRAYGLDVDSPVAADTPVEPPQPSKNGKP